jgi:nucleolar protein 12
MRFRTTQSAQKQLRRHILAFVPTARIESTRFRSIAFQAPTGGAAAAEPAAKSETRAHERERAASWRKDQDGEDAAKAAARLSAGEKKRIAFIRHEIHAQADAVNAYVVFAHADPASTRTADVMDPCTAARNAVDKAHGSVFLGRTLRVDAVAKTAQEAKGDPRRTVFVGNLDFASKEEDLRVYFEGIVSAERGPPAADDDEDDDDGEDGGDGEEGPKPKSWVTRVRIVRDKETLLGKGFAYVEFSVCLPLSNTVPFPQFTL